MSWTKQPPHFRGGTCSDCRFSIPIPKQHHAHQYYPLFCKRFPPHAPKGDLGIWNANVPVGKDDWCWEWRFR